MNHQQALLLVAIAACAIAAVIDLRTGTIPNWLTLGLFGCAPVARAALALSERSEWRVAFAAAVASVVGGAISALLPLLLSRSGGLGMGDVKLFAALGAACGALVGLSAQTYAYVVALVYAVVILARRRRLRTALANIKALLGRRRAAGPAEGAGLTLTEVRFGPAILAGMCLAAWAQWSS